MKSFNGFERTFIGHFQLCLALTSFSAVEERLTVNANSFVPVSDRGIELLVDRHRSASLLTSLPVRVGDSTNYPSFGKQKS